MATKLISTAPEEHCDWCGEELGSVRHWVWSRWRGENIRVHPGCRSEVIAKNSSVYAALSTAESGK